MLSFFVMAQSSDWKSCMINGDVPTLQCVEVVIVRLLKFASSLTVFLIFVMFVLGAYYYLTAFGDSEKVKKAQNTMKYAIIGLLVFVSAYLIIRMVGFFLLGKPDALLKFDFGQF